MLSIPETHYLRDGDVHIAYQVVGDGPRDLVFLSGWDTAIDFLWDEPRQSEFFERLASFSRLILFDKRGTGASDWVSLAAMPTLESWVDDVRLVMDEVGSEEAAIFASTFTGPLAVLFAATHPERTSALVLAHTFARFRSTSGYPAGLSDDEAEAGIARAEDEWGTGDLLAVYAPSLAGDERLRRWWNRCERLSMSKGTVGAFLRMVTDSDVRSILPVIQCPTLVVESAATPAVISWGKYMAANISTAQLRQVAEVDSLPWLNTTLAGDVEEFLTGARNEPDSNRVLATVVFSDLVGSTQHAAELGDQKWRGILDDYESLVDRLVARFQGRCVKNTGDGTLATFAGPARAIRFAEALRESVRDLGLELRSGVHTGEIELRADDVAGIAVHIGQRVSDLARSGEVLVSRTVVDLVAGSGIEFSDRGEHNLKGVPGTWRLFTASG